MITHKQLSLAEVFDDCQNKFDNNKYQFLSLLDETINLDEIVLVSFVPDASKFTRFKQDFLLDLQSMFDHLVDLTEPVCQKLNPALASMTIFDTSDIEAWVTENNPKYANRIIKQLKAFKKFYPEKNLRAYPGVERGSQEWEDTYKIRVNVEISINHFKDSFCIVNRKTQNEKTLHADLPLAGITQLVTVLVADKLHQYQYIRSLKPLIA